MQTYYNEVDAWDSIESIYSTRDKADYRILELEEDNASENISFSVKEWAVH